MSPNYITFLLLLSTILLQPIALAEQSTSSWPSLTKHVLLPPNGQRADAFHMVVIGDSIAWGNGLSDQDKYYCLVANWLQKELNKSIDVAVYAHSGATISGETGISIDPNLNSVYPTLMDQANNIQNKDEVDLILISGGINDVGVMNILNAYIPPDDIDQRAQSIKDPLVNLLSYLLGECKNAKIMVTNYYPIVSDDSDVTLIASVYGLGIFIINNALNGNVLDAFTIKERLTENSFMFHGSTTTAITNAVLETDNAANRVVLANVNFGSINSYAASETWLWKLIAPQASMESPMELSLDILRTDDDQFDYRSSLASDPIDKINAIGHPNVEGAKEYARAIESALESKGLDWLQNESAASSGANAGSGTGSNPPTAEEFQVTETLAGAQVSTQEFDQQESSASNPLTAQPGITAQAPSEEWNRTFGGTGSDVVNSVQLTSDGGYILSGRTYSFGAGSEDAWLIKVDSQGNELWNRTFGGRGGDFAYLVQQISDGDYILSGVTQIISAGDAWLIKTDSDGNELWNRTLVAGSPYYWMKNCHSNAKWFQPTNDNGYVLAGDVFNCGVGGDWDARLIKVDSQGNEIWNRTFGGKRADMVYSISLTSDGGYILAGSTQSFGAGINIIEGWKNAWLIKVDSDGNELWNRTFGAGFDEVHSVQPAPDGGYISAGITNGNAWLIKADSDGNEIWNRTFGADPGDFNLVQPTSDDGYILAGRTGGDAWLVKTDSKGSELWNMTFGGMDYDEFYSVQPTSGGGYILAGRTESFGAGSNDAWLIKTDARGDVATTYVTSTENNFVPGTDTKEEEVTAEMKAEAEKTQSGIQEEVVTEGVTTEAMAEAEKTQSGIREEAVTAKASGFGGILAIVALLCILIFSRKD